MEMYFTKRILARANAEGNTIRHAAIAAKPLTRRNVYSGQFVKGVLGRDSSDYSMWVKDKWPPN